MEVSADNRLSVAKNAADKWLSAAKSAADNQLYIFPMNYLYRYFSLCLLLISDILVAFPRIIDKTNCFEEGNKVSHVMSKPNFCRC